MAARKEGVGGEEEAGGEAATSAAAAVVVCDDDAAAAARAQERNWRADAAAVEAPPSLCVSCWPRTTGLEIEPALTERATAAATARIIVADVVDLAVAAGVFCLVDRQPLTGERGLVAVPRPLLLQLGGPVEEAGAAPRICCPAWREKEEEEEERRWKKEGENFTACWKVSKPKKKKKVEVFFFFAA